MILFFLTKLKKTVTLVALRMVFIEVFLAFSAIAAFFVGISVGRLWTSREQQGRTPDPVRWDDRCQPNSRRGRAPKPFGGEPTQVKEWIFVVDLSLRTGMIKDGQDQVDFASSFLEGTALLWFLSCLESRKTFANWAELKESLSATFGPLDEEEDDRLNLFALTQTGPLDDYIQDFSRLSLNVTALDEHSRALLFVRGLTDGLRADAMREHPRTLSEAIRAARTARRNAVLTRPRGSVGSSRNRRALDTAENVASTEQPVSSQRFKRQKLTDEERAKLMREGRCFRCRSAGHLSKDCPENNFGSPNVARQ